jgi:selenocysteine lyase/cysteine desulfurase
MYDLSKLRAEEFPLSTQTIYFNHASISPVPQRAKAKMQWSAELLAQHPSRHFMQDGLPMMMAFHQEIADFINAAGPQEIVPVTSTSAALNQIAQSLPLQAGDNICFCEIEFPSNAYPWMSLERDGIEIRHVPAVNGGLTVEALELLVDARTRVVAVSAVQFFSGHRADLQALGEFCQQRGLLFVVDAIQAIGHLRIDVQAMKIDVLASGGQKSLMAPPGVGFMYVRDAVAESLTPRSIGPNATRDWLFWLDYDLTPMPGAARFMAGTPNVVGMFGLLESLRLLRELDVEQIDQYTTGLAAEALERLARLGYRPVTQREEHSAIVTVESGLSDDNTNRLVSYLDEHGISIVKHWSPQRLPHVRLSFHCYNTTEELDQFEAIIKDFQP